MEDHDVHGRIVAALIDVKWRDLKDRLCSRAFKVHSLLSEMHYAKGGWKLLRLWLKNGHGDPGEC